MRHWGARQDYSQGLGPNVVDEESVVDSKTRASRERKWKVDIAVDIIRCTKNCGGSCRSGVHWLPGANELDLSLRYFCLCLDLPHAGSVARMPRRRQALIRRRRLASYEYWPLSAPRILIPKSLPAAVLHLEILKKVNNALTLLRLRRSKSLEFPWSPYTRREWHPFIFTLDS